MTIPSQHHQTESWAASVGGDSSCSTISDSAASGEEASKVSVSLKEHPPEKVTIMIGNNAVEMDCSR